MDAGTELKFYFADSFFLFIFLLYPVSWKG